MWVYWDINNFWRKVKYLEILVKSNNCYWGNYLGYFIWSFNWGFYCDLVFVLFLLIHLCVICVKFGVCVYYIPDIYQEDYCCWYCVISWWQHYHQQFVELLSYVYQTGPDLNSGTIECQWPLQIGLQRFDLENQWDLWY